MPSSLTTAALLVALGAALLLLLEREKLPHYAALQHEHARLAQDALAYDLSDLAAPTLSGAPLRVSHRRFHSALLASH